MRNDLITSLQKSLITNNLFYSREFHQREIDLFSQYYRLVLQWNDLLHLTTILSPQEFAERHLLESAFASISISEPIQEVWDIGSGAGIPGIPIAILRPELIITLIESNRKKSIFLKEVISALHLNNLKVSNQRFESLRGVGRASCVISRSLDRIEGALPDIIKFGQGASQIILLGNQHLQEIAGMSVPSNWGICGKPIPLSEKRFLISITCFT